MKRTRKFKHEGKEYEVRVWKHQDEYRVAVFDHRGEQVSPEGSVPIETAIDFETVKRQSKTPDDKTIIVKLMDEVQNFVETNRAAELNEQERELKLPLKLPSKFKAKGKEPHPGEDLFKDLDNKS